MTTTQEIIQQQQELIEQYKTLINTYKDTQNKLYEYISEIHKLLLTNDPIGMKVAITHIGTLAAKAKQ